MRRIHPRVEEAVDTLDLNRATRRRLLAGTGLASASLAATALLTACGDSKDQAEIHDCPVAPFSRGQATVRLTPLGPAFVINDRDADSSACACR